MTGEGSEPVGRRFAAYFKVRQHEADTLGHVNNAAYLNYLEQAAIEHSAAAGYPYERYREMGALFIIRRHEIEYLRPARPGDILQVVTWAVGMRGARALRDYEVYLYERDGRAVPADGFLGNDAVPGDAPLLRARTEWVFVDIETGRPRRIPRDMIHRFGGG